MKIVGSGSGEGEWVGSYVIAQIFFIKWKTRSYAESERYIDLEDLRREKEVWMSQCEKVENKYAKKS